MANASYTRKDLERVIDEGGSVLHGQRVITRKEDLPSAAELAQGDPAAEAQTAEDLDAQIARLQAQKTQLADAAKQRDVDAKAKADADKAEADAKDKGK